MKFPINIATVVLKTTHFFSSEGGVVGALWKPHKWEFPKEGKKYPPLFWTTSGN